MSLPCLPGAPPARERLVYLEAMRGIAALVVVAMHFCYAYDDSVFFPNAGDRRWYGMPWFVVINGSAAVQFFFLLSGYVLALAPLRRNSGRTLATSVLKRWPRLAGPVVVAILCSYVARRLHLFHYAAASVITGSEWLRTFAAAIDPNHPPDFGLHAALAQGLWRTFLYGDFYFDSVLWTMSWEFYGSLIVFALVAGLLVVRFRVLQFAVVLVAGYFVLFWNPYYFEFVLGAGLAWLWVRVPFALPRWLAMGLIALGIFLLGYHSPIDAYAWMPSTMVPPLGIGAALVVFAAGRCVTVLRHLEGRTGALLGRYSFPIYLTHTLVIMSVGMLVFTRLYPLLGKPLAFVPAVFVSLVGIAGAAYLMGLFERHWVGFLNLHVRRLVDATLMPMRAGRTRQHAIEPR